MSMDEKSYSRKKYISEIFNDKELIGKDHIEYFYTKYPNMCCNFKDIKPFFNDIAPFAYSGLSVKIGNMYKNVNWNTSSTRKSEPPANKKTILKYHAAWARANGYKPQAASSKRQAPSALKKT